MATALFTDAELICFDHDIMEIIRKIKNQYQRADINSIHKKIIKIPDYHDVSNEFLNILTEKLLKNVRIRNKPNRGNASLTLSDVTIEIPIHDDSYPFRMLKHHRQNITYKLLITVQSHPRYQKLKN